MAYIILPSRRTRQPQGAVRLRPELAFADFWLPTVPVGLVTQRPQVATSTEARSWGITHRLNGTFVLPVVSDSTLVLPTQSCSIVLAGKSLTPDAYGQFGILQSTELSYRCGAHVPFTDGTIYFDFGGAAEGVTRVSIAGLSFAESDVLIFTTGPRGMEIWQNGRLRASNSATPTREQLDSLSWGLGGNNIAPGNPRDSAWYGFGLSKTQWSQGTCADVSANLWASAFAPDTRRIYFGASGGGANIFESTFATSWSLSEAYSASATLVSTYADSPTATDSSSSSAVFSSAFDETIPVSDGPSADMGGVANRTQEESFTITDAYSASMVATATISETLSAEASLAASAIFNATFAETLPIVDGEEADAGRISDIAENVSVTDAYTAGIVAQVTQAESVTTSDTYDTIAIYNPALEETLSITDAVGATLTVPTSGTVDLSQESIDALALEIMNQLTSVPVRRL